MDTYPSPGSFGPTGRVAPPLPRRTSIVLRPRFPWRKLAWVGGVLVALCLLALGTGYRYTKVSPGTLAVSVPPVDAGDAPGRSWAQGRFHAPYLRDALLDEGVLVETLETATFWSRLEPLHDAVTAVTRGEVDIVILTSGVQLAHLWQVVEMMACAMQASLLLRHAPAQSELADHRARYCSRAN